MNRSAALNLLQLSSNSTLAAIRAVLNGERGQGPVLRRNAEQTRAALDVLRETGSFVRPMSIAESDAKRERAREKGTGVSGTPKESGKPEPASTGGAGSETAGSPQLTASNGLERGGLIPSASVKETHFPVAALPTVCNQYGLLPGSDPSEDGDFHRCMRAAGHPDRCRCFCNSEFTPYLAPVRQADPKQHFDDSDFTSTAF